jgi:hypothetical protein
MFNQVFDTIYKFFSDIYDSFIIKKNKNPIHKYEQCDDEEYLYLNQEDNLMYLNNSI